MIVMMHLADLNFGSACCDLVQSLLSSCVQFEDLRVEIYKSISIVRMWVWVWVELLCSKNIDCM
jgi:hypothetical protein